MPLKDPDGRRAYQRRKGAEWYQRNRELVLARSKARRERVSRMLHAEVLAYKRERGCARCGKREGVRLDLHHPDRATKDFNVSEHVHSGGSVERLWEEVAKCVVLCASCHKITHHDLSRGYHADPLLSFSTRLPASMIEHLRALGGGNVSRGLRRLYDERTREEG